MDRLCRVSGCQAEAAREAQKAGIGHPKAIEPQRYRGRKPSFDRAQLGIVRDMLAQDASPTAIAEAARASRQVVYSVQDDPAKAEAMLAEWGLCSGLGGWSGAGPEDNGGPARCGPATALLLPRRDPIFLHDRPSVHTVAAAR